MDGSFFIAYRSACDSRISSVCVTSIKKARFHIPLTYFYSLYHILSSL